MMTNDTAGGAPTQQASGTRFKELHERPEAFVIPNPWDIGSARLLAHLGFEALATTSAGHAAAAGLPDGCSGREATLAHVATIAAATDRPVSADLENGFGDEPESVAATITDSAARGAVGGSIEDLAARPDGGGLYDIALATERIRAAAEAARALPFPYTLTARCECFLAGHPDLEETIRRLRAYAEAGADVLYAPGLPTRRHIQAVTAAVERPVNVVVGLGGEPFTVAELTEMGVRRISLGSSLARLAIGAMWRAAQEMRESGTFGSLEEAMPYATLNDLLASR